MALKEFLQFINPYRILITNPNFNEGNVISKEGTVIK